MKKETPMLDGGYDSSLTYESQCMRCKHYIHMGQCDAFDKIPMDLWTAKSTHDTPRAGDHGILFESL